MGFTLVELAVVIAIIGVLAALILGSLASAKRSATRTACLSNLRQIGLSIHMYADDHGGSIPYGPKAPPFDSPASFYPSTGSPTSLLSLRRGARVGLGLLLDQYVGKASFFCPGTDDPLVAAEELANVAATQAQGSYYYRHGGNTRLFDDPNDTGPPSTLRLADLGRNRDGAPIRALAIDTQFLCPPDLAAFNVKPRTHHQQEFSNVLRADGSTRSLKNREGRLTVDARDYGELRNAFDNILKVFERADVEP